MSAKDGKPCKKCGGCEWLKNGKCKLCNQQYNRQWRSDNQEKHLQINRDWYHATKNTPYQKERNKRKSRGPDKAAAVSKWKRENQGKVREMNRRYSEVHHEKERERKRIWARANPDKLKAKAHRRRDRILGGGGEFTAAEWQQLCDYYDNKCLCCGREDVQLTVDHVVPVAKGGTGDIGNIQPLCGKCNSKKGDKYIDYRNRGAIARWIQRRLL